ncbi:MAG: patatin-like phospholipase family protein [Clostridiales bacterium]|nr:patatin-like phospholipase family protein [Clostridiales bacterium]
MKRALVFSGGGARGAYELGAWQALDEIGLRFDAVYGTSIGAINAAYFAQGDLALARSLWEGITMKQIVVTKEEDFSIDVAFHNKLDVLPFLLDNVNHLRMDIAPLEKRVREGLNEGKLRACGMELGVMAVAVPQMAPVPMRLKDMKDGTVADWLIASASAYPIFQTKVIGRQRYIDGGYYDNLPVDMALQDGASEVVAVDIHPAPAHPEYAHMPFLRMVHPRGTLSAFLDFKPALIDRMRRMGYYDTLKAFDRMQGIVYTFRRGDDVRTAREAARFQLAVARFDASVIDRHVFHTSQKQQPPLITALTRETPERALTKHEVWLRGLELAAACMGFREDAIYDPDALARRMLSFVRAREDVPPLTEEGLATAAQFGSRALVKCIARGLAEDGAIPRDMVPHLAAIPDETAAAMFLFSLEGTE